LGQNVRIPNVYSECVPRRDRKSNTSIREMRTGLGQAFDRIEPHACFTPRLRCEACPVELKRIVRAILPSIARGRMPFSSDVDVEQRGHDEAGGNDSQNDEGQREAIGARR
jgi:hypothetical protein